MKQFVPHFLALLLASASSALALEVRFLAWDEEIAVRKVAVMEGDKAHEIKGLHPLQRTDELGSKLVGGTLTVRALDRKSAEGKVLDLPVKVGTGMTHPLILLLPDQKAPTGLRGFAIEDDSASFPWGSFRILNATGKALSMGMGEERKQLPAGWQPVDLKPAGDKPLPVWFATAEAPKAPLYTGVWKPEGDIRRLVILVPGTEARLGPLALKVIPEDRRSLATVAAP